MLLRASSIHTGEAFDVSAVTSDEVRPVGVPGEAILLKFADSAMRRDERALAEAREAIDLELGREALVDAAATVASFQRLTRVADGCGIELDSGAALMTGGLQQELGIQGFASAANTPKPKGFKRLLAMMIRPFEGFMLKGMQKGVQRAKARRSQS